MSRSWSHADRLRARVRACRWELIPETYRVRVDDTYQQYRYAAATRHLDLPSVPAFLQFAAAYVIRHHRELTEMRAQVRRQDKVVRERLRRGRKPCC